MIHTRSVRVVTIGVACWLTALAAAQPVELRIVTYNVEAGIADTPQRREAAGNLLTTRDLDPNVPGVGLAPDIVCMQESRSKNDLKAFRDEFLPGYQVLRGASYYQDPGGNTQAYFLRGDIRILKFDELAHGGPRRHHRLVLEVPGSEGVLVLYNAHFKAGSRSGDIQTRRNEADRLANRIADDFANGIDLTGNQIPDVFPTHYLSVGDFNQDDFSGTVIDPLLAGGSGGLPTGLNDVRMETLAGRTVGWFVGGTFSTRSGLQRRYDYVLASQAIFDQFDLDKNKVWTQAELNAAGFVYVSGDDGGLHSNGDVDATRVASDHAPVIVDFALVCDVLGDVDGDCDVDAQDLTLLLASWAKGPGDPGYNPNANFDEDPVIGPQDLTLLLSNWGAVP